jgi:hypothetical protein
VKQESPIIVIQEDESFVSKNPTSSPSTTTTSIPSSSSTSSPASSPSPPPRKVKYLNEIYGYSNFGLMSQIEAEPRFFEDATKHESWCKAMDKEIAAIKRNETWELVDPPIEKEVISVKWVYKTKYVVDGSIQNHKARLVAKGFAQHPGIDCD